MRSLTVSLSFLLCLGLTAQHALAPDSLRADLRYYAEAIKHRHIRPFAVTSEIAFDAAVRRADSILVTGDVDRLVVELLRLAAMLNDEHTMVLAASSGQLPYRFRYFPDGLAVVAADSAHRAQLLYRVLAINDVPASGILDRFGELVKQDNASYALSWLDRNIGDPQLLKGLGIIARTDSIVFDLVSPAGDTVRSVVSATPTGAPVQWWQPPSPNGIRASESTAYYTIDHDEQGRTLYFNYRRCQVDPDLPFSEFNKQLFTLVREQHPERIIIDLRANGGGNSAVLAPFLKELRKSYLNKEGRIRVLIGRDTFSSAVMNAVALKRETSAILIGEPTGGNINHFGEVRDDLLPHSHIRFTWSTRYWENWKGMNGALQPDVLVTPSLGDLISGIDAAYQEGLAP